MPVKRPEFINGEIYHTILRGIAGQKIFLGQDDYLRCIFDLYKFNDIKRIARDYRYQEFALVVFHDNTPKIRPDELKRGGPRDLLVEILGFCLMPDHIHLLVRQLVDNGISMFFQKMGGYSTYFNKKHERFGSLFQRPFKAIHIRTQNQLLIVITYAHLNPISLIESEWNLVVQLRIDVQSRREGHDKISHVVSVPFHIDWPSRVRVFPVRIQAAGDKAVGQLLAHRSLVEVDGSAFVAESVHLPGKVLVFPE